MTMITPQQVTELKEKARSLRLNHSIKKTLFDREGDLNHEVFSADRALEMQAPAMSELIAEQAATINKMREFIAIIRNDFPEIETYEGYEALNQNKD